MPEITEKELELLQAAKARRDIQKEVMRKLNATFTKEERSKRMKKAWRTRRKYDTL